MSLPEFNAFSLQDSTYLTEKINHRTRAARRIESEVVSRRMGMKLLNSQIQQKVIQISGHILASTASDLMLAVDNLHKNISAVEGALVIESGRTYQATAERVSIPDQSYNQTIVEFDIQFVCVRPFSEGANQIATFIIPSGSPTFQLDTTISGSASNRPIFSFLLPSGVGTSPVVSLMVQYSDTANAITLSGIFQTGDNLVANYDRYLVTVNGSNADFTGLMDEIEAGDATFLMTVSGRNDGIRGTISYNPRYF